VRLSKRVPIQKNRLVHRSKPYRFRGDIGPIYAGGNRPYLLRHIAAQREVFYRFTTTPDWKAADAASASAALAMKGK